MTTRLPSKPPKRRDPPGRSDDLFRELANSIPQALWICEPQTLCYVNPKWRSVTGRQLAAGDGAAKLYDAIHPEDRQSVLNELSRLPRGGADFECRLLRADGCVLWVRIRTFPIGGSAEQCLVAGIMEDITGLRSETKSIEQRMNDFVSTVSHELRTPLTSISGSLGLLAGNAAWQLLAAAERLLSIAYANSNRLVRLVNDLLDIEKIESGNVVFDPKPVNVHALVEQAIEANQWLCRKL